MLPRLGSVLLIDLLWDVGFAVEQAADGDRVAASAAAAVAPVTIVLFLLDDLGCACRGRLADSL